MADATARFGTLKPKPMPTRPATLRIEPTTQGKPPARPSPSRRGYGRVWQRARLWKLAHDPECEACGAAATEVDHVTALTRGGTNDAANLQSLCKSCHSKKTCAIDGGLGRPRPNS